MLSKHLLLQAALVVLLLSVSFAVEKWTQIGRDAQNTKRSTFTSSAPSDWQVTLADQEFVISSYFDSVSYFAVDGDSGTWYLSLQSSNWAATTVYGISMQDGSIKKKYSFDTKCDFKQCPFSLAYGKNHILSKTGDLLTEYQMKKAGAVSNTIGLAGFSFADTGKIAWTYEFDASVAGTWQVSEPSSITSDDYMIFPQYSDPNGYSISAVKYLQKDSAPVWTIPFDKTVTGPAVDENDNVYINYNNTNILKIDGKTGHIITTTESLPTGLWYQTVSVKPAVGNKRVYQVARNGTMFYAVGFTNDESQGASQKLLWSTLLEISPPSPAPYIYPYYCASPVVAPNTQGHNGDETLYINCFHPNGTISIVYALNAVTGEQVWSSEISRAPKSYLICNSAALSTGGKYLSLGCLQMFNGNSQIVVLETTTGKVVNTWTREHSYRMFMFLDQDDYVYLGYSVYDSQTQKTSTKIEKKALLEQDNGPQRMNIKKRIQRNK